MDGNTDFCKAEVSQQECTIPFANFLVLASSLYPYDPLLKPWGFLHSCTEIVNDTMPTTSLQSNGFTRRINCL